MLEAGGEFAAGGEVIVQIFQLDKRLELREQGQNFVDLLVVQENAEDCLTALPLPAAETPLPRYIVLPPPAGWSAPEA